MDLLASANFNIDTERCCRYDEKNAHRGASGIQSHPMLLLIDMKLPFSTGLRVSTGCLRRPFVRENVSSAESLSPASIVELYSSIGVMF